LVCAMSTAHYTGGSRRPSGADAAALAGALLASYRRAVAATAGVADEIARAARVVGERWQAGGRCIYLGAGASGLAAAEDAAELPGTFGLEASRLIIVIAGGVARPFQIDASIEDDAEAGRREIAALGDLSGDAVFAVSASGSTPFTLGGAEAARHGGALLIGIANREGAPLLRLADISIFLDSGEEALRGSTRLAAGVAQKCALGLLSTLLGQELGHIHRGLMVNLRADNDKLRARAVGIVATLAGSSEAEARKALDAAAGEVKPAILMAAGARTREAAAALLAAAHGRLDDALARLN